jgi:hypothetical protein
MPSNALDPHERRYSRPYRGPRTPDRPCAWQTLFVSANPTSYSDMKWLRAGVRYPSQRRRPRRARSKHKGASGRRRGAQVPRNSGGERRTAGPSGSPNAGTARRGSGSPTCIGTNAAARVPGSSKPVVGTRCVRADLFAARIDSYRDPLLDSAVSGGLNESAGRATNRVSGTGFRKLEFCPGSQAAGVGEVGWIDGGAWDQSTPRIAVQPEPVMGPGSSASPVGTS